MSAAIPSLIAVLGHQFDDDQLLVQALTHGSSGSLPAGDYQRLEFLGDRVLGLVMAEALYAALPDAREGELSMRLNQLVSRATCADVARSLDIGPHIRLGKQARDDGARDSDNVLGDVMEALIGAVFVDGGMEPARAMVLRYWSERLAHPQGAVRHPKSMLMEWAAANRRKPPVYTLVDRSGPDHAPIFTVDVNVPNAGTARATGPNKQEAEKAAAAALNQKLGITA